MSRGLGDVYKRQAETFGKQQTDEALLAAGEEIKELKSAAKSREKEAVDLIISELI